MELFCRSGSKGAWERWEENEPEKKKQAVDFFFFFFAEACSGFCLIFSLKVE